MHKRGFTLIELLVVIAIIGILAGVVLASLQNARGGGGDAAVEADLVGIRTQAELYYPYYDRYRSAVGADYAGDCLTSFTMFRETTISGPARQIADAITVAIDAAYKAGGSTGKQCRIDASGSRYFIAIQLKSSTNYWCIDSTGASKSINALPADTHIFTC